MHGEFVRREYITGQVRLLECASGAVAVPEPVVDIGYMPGRRSKPPKGPPNRIYELREMANLTQEALATKIGTTYPTIQRLETGKIKLTEDKIRLLAGVFGVHPGEIFAPLPRYSDPDEERAARIIKRLSSEDRIAWLTIGETLARRANEPPPAAKRGRRAQR
jgi:transcriptional regulator with XRE-family HTH domain